MSIKFNNLSNPVTKRMYNEFVSLLKNCNYVQCDMEGEGITYEIIGLKHYNHTSHVCCAVPLHTDFRGCNINLGITNFSIHEINISPPGDWVLINDTPDGSVFPYTTFSCGGGLPQDYANFNFAGEEGLCRLDSNPLSTKQMGSTFADPNTEQSLTAYMKVTSGAFVIPQLERMSSGTTITDAYLSITVDSAVAYHRIYKAHVDDITMAFVVDQNDLIIESSTPSLSIALLGETHDGHLALLKIGTAAPITVGVASWINITDICQAYMTARAGQGYKNFAICIAPPTFADILVTQDKHIIQSIIQATQKFTTATWHHPLGDVHYDKEYVDTAEAHLATYGYVYYNALYIKFDLDDQTHLEFCYDPLPGFNNV